MNKDIIVKSENETYKQGSSFALKLEKGENLALYGNLGAGKTKFLQGLAKGLGVKETVNSPTFNILKIYKVHGHKKIKQFCHVDAYRLNSEKDLVSLGIEEYLSDPEIVVAIEWAEKIAKILPKSSWIIKLSFISENKRKLSIKKQP